MTTESSNQMKRYVYKATARLSFLWWLIWKKMFVFIKGTTSEEYAKSGDPKSRKAALAHE